MHLSVEHFRKQFRLKIIKPLLEQKDLPSIKYVIFDAHAVSYIDSKGVEILRETRDLLKRIGNVQLLIAGCNRSVYNTLNKCSFFISDESQEQKLLFATTIDAVFWVKLHDKNIV